MVNKNGNPPDDPNQLDRPDDANHEENTAEAVVQVVDLAQARLNITKYVKK